VPVTTPRNCERRFATSSRIPFKRIAIFDHPDDPHSKPVVCVLFKCGMHFDALDNVSHMKLLTRFSNMRVSNHNGKKVGRELVANTVYRRGVKILEEIDITEKEAPPPKHRRSLRCPFQDRNCLVWSRNPYQKSSKASRKPNIMVYL